MSDPPQDLLSRLPTEVLQHILSLLPQYAIRHVRYLNHALGAIATPLTFRHMRLSAVDDEYKRFVQVAMDERLRGLVQEVSVDTWVGPDFSYNCNLSLQIPTGFLHSLSYLRYFYSLSALNVRFTEWCGSDEYSTMADADEDHDIRYRVLDTLFRSLAGTWTPEKQREIDEGLKTYCFEDEYFDDEFEMPQVAKDVMPAGYIKLKTLTMSNLADFNDERLTKSDAFHKVLSTVVDLKLLITVQGDEASPESAIHFRHKYDMFEALPKTWLSPTVAKNLRVLSLYCVGYWGWNPRMDFRAINPGSGPDSGFPNLQVLALGNYIFSHEWQVDWIASLGRQNGHGSLLELYLDDCPILVKARSLLPMSSGETVVGQDLDGKAIHISNDGYPSKDVMIGRRDWQTKVLEFPLRWSSVLPRWRASMRGLKVFKMGHGSWNEPPPDAVLAAYGYVEGFSDILVSLQHQFDDNHFRMYSCPTPLLPEYETYDDGERDIKYKDGAGLWQGPEALLQYINFDIGIGPTAWLEDEEWYHDGDDEEEPGEDEIAQRKAERRAKDEAELELLKNAIRDRQER